MARILIVDDDSLVRELLEATLSIGEHELEEAPDGDHALAIATQRTPDLVILDMDMPGLGGHEVLVRLKAGTAARARVIVLTGSGRAREPLMRSAGAFAYLTKPFSPLELIGRIEEALASA